MGVELSRKIERLGARHMSRGMLQSKVKKFERDRRRQNRIW
jgi:hypothetical protein